MNSPIGTKDRPWHARISLYSGEATSTIPAGTPVCLNVNANAATLVVLPVTAATATANSLFAGVTANTVAPGDVAEIICSGYVATARYVMRTRGQSTDSYASVASRPAGAVYTVHTLNGFSFAADSSAAPAVAVLVESISSIPSSASAAGNTALVQYGVAKMWIRALV